MRLLLDGHTFLWYVTSNPSLSKRAEEVITSSEEVFLSVATVWELSIKHALGKLTLAQPPPQFFAHHVVVNGFSLLAIQPEHVFEATNLPRFAEHKDPFDRMLVGQARIEGLRIMSRDKSLDLYEVDRVW